MTLLLFRGPNHLTRGSHCVVAPGAKTQLGGLRGGGVEVTANLLVNKDSSRVSLRAQRDKRRRLISIWMEMREPQ